MWSLHPELLDRQGLIAGWREALLAQAVLAGRTRGYRRHPQLARFADQRVPQREIGRYLVGLADEADRRGYRFDRARIDRPGPPGGQLTVTDGQLALEHRHLITKLAARSPELVDELGPARAHPLFVVTSGPPAEWERVRFDHEQ
nr:pyrimidine dimer DNA glycosylase/endonuclease V [Naumannella cuiyingiana]